jgi:hypothetical protein
MVVQEGGITFMCFQAIVTGWYITEEYHLVIQQHRHLYSSVGQNMNKRRELMSGTCDFVYPDQLFVDNVCVQNKVPPGTQQLLGIGTAANIKEP